MITTIFTSLISFVSTNIDDIFVLMLFFAQEDQPGRKRQITLGQYLGIGILVAVSMGGASLLRLIPEHYIGFLGFVPIALGVKEWISYLKEKNNNGSEKAEKPEAGKSLAISVMLVTVANGADNLGVYIPLFAGYTVGQMLTAVVVFAMMVALWCLLAQKIASLPVLKAAIQKYRHIIVPVVFVALGVYILAENFL